MCVSILTKFVCDRVGINGHWIFARSVKGDPPDDNRLCFIEYCISFTIFKER